MKPPVWPIPIPPWRRHAQGAIDARGFSQSRRGAKAGHAGLLSQSCRSRRRRVEYFWITPFTNNGSQFAGEINNTPRVVHSVKLGQTAQSDIVDRLYIENGMMRGNYTACALLKSAPKNEAEEFKKTFGLNCDL